MGKNMNWELIKVKQTDWIQDDSGYYTLINWIDDNTVRLDVMDTDDMPVISFQGVAGDVRKHVMQHMPAICSGRLISIEHASYIGSELARAELLKTEYIQD